MLVIPRRLRLLIRFCLYAMLSLRMQIRLSLLQLLEWLQWHTYHVLVCDTADALAARVEE